MTLNKRKFILLGILSLIICFSFAGNKNVQYGYASYYADKFEGNYTKSGEIFNQKLYTAAHATLPFNTLVKVTHMRTKKSIVVKINDRCPKYPNRIIDLTKSAAKKLGIIWSGIGYIKLEVINPRELNMKESLSYDFIKRLNSDKNLFKGMMIYMNGYMTPLNRHIVRNIIQYKMKEDLYKNELKDKKNKKQRKERKRKRV